MTAETPLPPKGDTHPAHGRVALGHARKLACQLHMKYASHLLGVPTLNSPLPMEAEPGPQPADSDHD